MMASDRTVYGVGFKLIIRTGSVDKIVRKAVMDGLEGVGEQYRKKIKDSISFDDHSLAELRAMGHPYRVGAPANTLHGDDRIVHTQSGELKRSINKTRVEETTTRTFSVYITSNDPVMPYLIYGTTHMRPRRFHERAYELIKEVYWKPLTDKLAKVNYRIEEHVRG